jgi:chromosome segregation ATPase
MKGILMIATLTPQERHERAIRAKQDISRNISEASNAIDSITATLGEYERRQADVNAAVNELSSNLEKIGPQIIEARAKQRLYSNTPDEQQWINRLGALQKEQTTTKTMLDQVQEQQRRLEEEIAANYQQLVSERADLIAQRADLQKELSVCLNEEREAYTACAQADLAQWLTKIRDTKEVILEAQADLVALEQQAHDALLQKYGNVASPLLAQALPHSDNPTYQLFSATIDYLSTIERSVRSGKLRRSILVPNDNGFLEPRALTRVLAILPSILDTWLSGDISRLALFRDDVAQNREHTIEVNQ